MKTSKSFRRAGPSADGLLRTLGKPTLLLALLCAALSPFLPVSLSGSSRFSLDASVAWGDIAFVKTIGSTATTITATNTTIVVPAGGVATGNAIILTLATDPVSGSFSCADNRGNTYTVDANIANGSGTSGVRTAILSARNIVALAQGDVISCSHPSSSARVLSANEFSGIASALPVDKTKTGTGSSTSPSSGSTATTTQAVELLFGAVGVEGAATETFTSGAGYATAGRAGTTAVTADSNITVNPEYKLVSATAAYAATGTLGAARKWSAAIVAYKAAAVATQLAVTSINSSVNPTAGTVFPVVVQSQNSAGLPSNVVNPTSVTLSLKSGSGTLGGTLSGTIAAGSSQMTFAGVTYTKAESGIVVAATRSSGDSLTSDDSAPFTVDPGIATKLVFTTQPGATPAGIPLLGPPTVAVQDNFGNTISSSSASISIGFAKNAGSGTLSGTTTKSAVGGIATFGDLSINKVANGYTLSASAPGLIAVTSSSFNIVTPVIDLVVSTLTNPPATAVAGSSFSVTDTTVNNGNITAISVTTNYRLSLNKTIDSSDPVLIGTRSVGPLAPATNSSGTNTVMIPVNVAPGKYLLAACADSTNAVAESNETNNCKLSANTVTIAAAPNVTSISPASGPVATAVTISGANFGTAQGTSTVTFNGVAGTPTSWNGTNIVVPVPAGASTGPVVVTVGGSSSNGIAFTVPVPPPLINSLTPNSGPVGSSVTISGANFGATQGSSTVRFNGVLANATNWSASSVTASVPVGASTGPVVVNVGGTGSNSNVIFSVTLLPTKLAISAVNNGANPAAGVAFPMIVQARDANGNPANVSNATALSLSLKTGSGTLDGTLTGTIAAGTNQTTISGVTYTTAESGVVLTASRTSGDPLTSADSAPVTVDPGAAAKLAFIAQPGNAIAGNVIPGTPTVSVQDNFGNLVGSSTASIAMAIGNNPTGASLGGATTQNASNGVANFNDLIIDRAGVGFTLTASSSGLSNATSAAFDVIGATGTVAGTISRNSDGRSIGGALIEALQGGVLKGSATSGDNGNYTIAGLNAGTYDFRASAGGYRTQTQNGVSVTANTSTTLNLSLTPSSNSQGIVYAYDAVGRLRGVINPVGEAATYSYDAVGNILAISRFESSQVSVIEFTPKTGAPGTSVTIYGTGYSATPGQNAVTFNGVPATVSSSTSTRVVATVPPGASTGTIAVSSSNGSATSSEAFSVPTASADPAITGFSPSAGAIGTLVTITGSNFSTTPGNNVVRFNNAAFAPVISSSATSITTKVPGTAGSGRISVATSFGTAISSNDFFIAPSPYGGNDVVDSGRIEVDGNSKTLAVGSTGKVSLLVFDGAQGQFVSLGVNSVTVSGVSLSIKKPDGSHLTGADFIGTFANLHATLPVTGTYTILVAPTAMTTGSITLTLSSEVNAGTIVVDGDPGTINIGRVGQRGYLTFAGTAGQNLDLGPNSSTIPGDSDLWVYAPNGTVVTGTTTFDPTFTSQTRYNFHMALPVTGIYKILIDPHETSTGSVIFTLSSQVEAGVVMVDGSSSSAATTRIGQRARWTFNGTAQQWVSLGVNSNSGNPIDLAVYNPNGSFLTGSDQANTSTNFHMNLPSTGQYTIFMDPSGTNISNLTITISSEVDGGTLQINGPALPISTSRVGQRGRFLFDGAANQQITVRTSNDTSEPLVLVMRQNGDAVLVQFSHSPGSNLGPVTLPATETYYVYVDPLGTGTASLSVAITSP